MVRVVKVYHECEVGCPTCYSTGEGQHENSSCWQCRGKGTLWERGGMEDESEVEWTKDDLSDFEVIDGHDECEYCGQNLFQYAKEQLAWELKNEANERVVWRIKDAE